MKLVNNVIVGLCDCVHGGSVPISWMLVSVVHRPNKGKCALKREYAWKVDDSVPVAIADMAIWWVPVHRYARSNAAKGHLLHVPN